MTEEFIDLTNGSDEFEELVGYAQPTQKKVKSEEITTTLPSTKPETRMSPKDILYLERVCVFGVSLFSLD